MPSLWEYVKCYIKLTEQITLYLCDDALENATFLDILFQSLLEAAAISNCCKLTIEGK